ncbi:Pentalenene synthase [Termitomyces sp. J132]|nr:Pentalenene synthase [Termitomyces sp. J132]
MPPHRIRQLFNMVAVLAITYAVDIWFTSIHDAPSGKRRLGSVAVINKLHPVQWQATKLTTSSLSSTAVQCHPSYLPSFSKHITQNKDSALVEADNTFYNTKASVYCNGSGYKGNISAVAVLFIDGEEANSLKYHLRPKTQHIVYEAKIIDIPLGLQLLTDLANRLPAQVAIGSDSQATIRALFNQCPHPAYYLLDWVHTSAEKLHTKQNRLICFQAHSCALCQELLASLAYPLESKDVERAGCDIMNLFFAFDAYTDIAVPHEAQQLASIVMDGLRNPDKPRPSGESVIGEIARQFSKISMKCASEIARRRFIAKFDMYTAAVVQETIDRAENHIRSIDDYFLVRRHTIGAMPSFVLLHFELELPEEVFEDPVIQRLENASADMISLCNDICSYNIEQARGNDYHNIVTIAMHHEQLGLKEAMRWAGDYYLKLEKDFLADMKSVPSFGKTLDVEVRRYVDGLGNWWVRDPTKQKSCTASSVSF